MKAVRRPMFWYGLAMWVLSVVISTLLIQLGALIMSDVPTAGKRIAQNDFVNTTELAAIDIAIAQTERLLADKTHEIEDARFVLRSRTLDYQNQRASFENWVKTRSATGADDQNSEVVERVRAIELLKQEERDAGRLVEDLQQEVVAAKRKLQDLRGERSAILAAANAPYQKAQKREVLKVFLFRLVLTLPLLLIAGWLVMKKRQSSYWPVYRGFIIFALFAFFVELVPYLPSYGGYVRYIVGILLALILAHFATRGMARYLQKKQSEEQRPETEKRKLIEYETAIKKISDGVCPSCDRQFGAQNSRKADSTPASNVDFCVHCGFCLYNSCGNCGQRENSFYKFCGACGVPAQKVTP
ncbi:hypothetical protein [Sulfitobacter geojensis]|uniref:hypothetical protein n=1 Tax=Sulfitobacter geojensis TaxID=1342299 RepID=UPI00249169F2|nr:hypothetical protein [Sulfitobacter geojensis]